MPVRSLSSSVLRWPDGPTVREAARRWASALLSGQPEVVRVGYFGSYASGDHGVGSDLDLVVVLRSCAEPFERRAALIETAGIPVPADVMVYTREEFERVLGRGDRWATELRTRTVWFERVG